NKRTLISRVKGLVKTLGKQEVADTMGVTVPTVSRWLRNGPPATREPSLVQLGQAAPLLASERAGRALAEAAADWRAVQYLAQRGMATKGQVKTAKKRLTEAKRRLPKKRTEGGLL